MGKRNSKNQNNDTAEEKIQGKIDHQMTKDDGGIPQVTSQIGMNSGIGRTIPDLVDRYLNKKVIKVALFVILLVVLAGIIWQGVLAIFAYNQAKAGRSARIFWVEIGEGTYLDELKERNTNLMSTMSALQTENATISNENEKLSNRVTILETGNSEELERTPTEDPRCISVEWEIYPESLSNLYMEEYSDSCKDFSAIGFTPNKNNGFTLEAKDIGEVPIVGLYKRLNGNAFKINFNVNITDYNSENDGVDMDVYFGFVDPEEIDALQGKYFIIKNAIDNSESQPFLFKHINDGGQATENALFEITHYTGDNIIIDCKKSESHTIDCTITYKDSYENDFRVSDYEMNFFIGYKKGNVAHAIIDFYDLSIDQD